jgi:hypothetical protein
VEGFWRTLIADNITDDDAYRPYSDLDMAKGVSTWYALCKGVANGVLINSTDLRFKLGIAFSEKGAFTTLGRKFCVTREGRMGLVPSGAKEDGLVCALEGGESLFLVQPVLKDGVRSHNEYHLVGECYIHGLMHKAVWEIGSKLQTIDLI